jgi:hypothetical protein
MFQQLLSVHGDKGFFISLATASLLNGLSLIGWTWAVFFAVAVMSRSALESSWPLALALSLFFCTLAILAPMPTVQFPGQTTNVTLPCDANCLMGFIGFQPVAPYNFTLCPPPPVYCENINVFQQISVSVGVAISVALMRLGSK